MRIARTLRAWRAMSSVPCRRRIRGRDARDGGGRTSVLASARFGDDAACHFHGEQALADSVVDFMRASVEEIFAA